MSLSRSRIIKNFTRIYDSQKYIIAMAVGSGISAKYAAANGIDLILTLNAGKYRQMGLSSLAAMMPFSNSNEMVFDFASKEIIPQIRDIPVVFGLCATDPTHDMEMLIDKIIDRGFSGIINFPTVGLIDGNFREILEEEGLSYQKEVQAIRIARKKDLFSIAFVFNPQQALQMAEVGADAICVHCGFTRGGTLGAKRSLSLKDASAMAKEIFDALDRQNAKVIKLVFGGPVQTWLDAKYILGNSGSMGFIGGSTFERIPIEKAIIEITSQFKEIGSERGAVINQLEHAEQNYSYINFIKNFVNEYYMEKILFKDLANSLHVSRNYLSSLFKKEMGCSFPSYLENTRLNMAKEIAQNYESITVKQLAEMVGYNDQSYFTRKFKEAFGKPPSAYMKK